MTDKTFTNDEFDRLSLNDRRAQSHTLDSSKVKQKVVGDVSTLDTFTNKVEKQLHLQQEQLVNLQQEHLLLQQ